MTYRFSRDFIVNIERFGGLLFERGGTPVWELDSRHAGYLKFLEFTGDHDQAIAAARSIHEDPDFFPDCETLTNIGALVHQCDAKALDAKSGLEAAYNFLQEEYAEARTRDNLRAPTTLTLYPDMRCQQSCCFCFLGENKDSKIGSRNVDAWLRLIEEAKELGVSSIALLGGEPTLYAGLTDIIRKCRELNINLGITSNGLKVSPKLMDLLSIDQNVLICFSLESMSSELHERYTGIGNEHVIRTIKRFSSAGIPFNVNTVGLGQELCDLEGVADFCADNGAKVWFVNLYYTKGERPPEFPGFSWYAKTDAHLRAYVASQHPRMSYQMFGCQLYWTYPEEQLKKGMTETTYNRLIAGCAAGQNQLEIWPDGEAVPCMQMGRDHFGCGNVFELGLREVWNNAAPLKALRAASGAPNEVCAGCDWFPTCQGGCAERRRQAKASFDVPMDPRCVRGGAQEFALPQNWMSESKNIPPNKFGPIS